MELHDRHSECGRRGARHRRSVRSRGPESVAVGGNLLPGYDMISDVPTANDGDGRDADATDPGDWLTQAEVTQSGGPFEDCSDSAEDSSWHGTQTTGIIAALTGNGIGMASVGRNVRVLPVRVLGKCGGYDSDIIAGMRWAVGLPVAGVPANPNPARVLNMSLGGDGPCDAAYLSAIADDHRGRRRHRRRRGQQRRSLGRFAGKLSRRHRRGRASSRRHESRLLRSRAGDRAERAGRQLRQRRSQRPLPVSDPHDDQPRSDGSRARMPPAARPTPTASTRRSARASRRRSSPAPRR